MFTESTADFAYSRLHGPERLYFGSYADRLAEWAARVRAVPGDRCVYFDNDADGAAPWDAVVRWCAVALRRLTTLGDHRDDLRGSHHSKA